MASSWRGFPDSSFSVSPEAGPSEACCGNSASTGRHRSGARGPESGHSAQRDAHGGKWRSLSFFCPPASPPVAQQIVTRTYNATGTYLTSKAAQRLDKKSVSSPTRSLSKMFSNEVSWGCHLCSFETWACQQHLFLGLVPLATEHLGCDLLWQSLQGNLHRCVPKWPGFQRAFYVGVQLSFYLSVSVPLSTSEGVSVCLFPCICVSVSVTLCVLSLSLSQTLL